MSTASSTIYLAKALSPSYSVRVSSATVLTLPCQGLGRHTAPSILLSSSQTDFSTHDPERDSVQRPGPLSVACTCWGRLSRGGPESRQSSINHSLNSPISDIDWHLKKHDECSYKYCRSRVISARPCDALLSRAHSLCLSYSLASYAQATANSEKRPTSPLCPAAITHLFSPKVVAVGEGWCATSSL